MEADAFIGEVGTLTEEQKHVADALGEFMSTTLSDWGNEVSMERYGYRKFAEAHYFPIQSDSGSVQTELAQGKDSQVKNLGFAKATVRNANNSLDKEKARRADARRAFSWYAGGKGGGRLWNMQSW